MLVAVLMVVAVKFLSASPPYCQKGPQETSHDLYMHDGPQSPEYPCFVRAPWVKLQVPGGQPGIALSAKVLGSSCQIQCGLDPSSEDHQELHVPIICEVNFEKWGRPVPFDS